MERGEAESSGRQGENVLKILAWVRRGSPHFPEEDGNCSAVHAKAELVFVITFINLSGKNETENPITEVKQMARKCPISHPQHKRE